MKTHSITSFGSLFTFAAAMATAAPFAHAGGQRCLEIYQRQQAEVRVFHGTTGVTDLMRAAVAGDINAAMEALRQGDAINARTSDTNAGGADAGGLTALMMAAGAGRGPMVRWLIECGADVTAQSANGQTALGRAVFTGESEATISIARALIAAGANPLADRPKNLTLLDVARRSGYRRLATLLSPAPATGAKK